MSEIKNALEVEVIIPQEVLDKNESLKKMYDDKKKSLSYVLGPETTKDLKDYIKDVIQTSEANEIALFNPIFSAISFIQKFRNLKYDPKKKNEKEYTQAKTILGKFNSGIKTTSSEIKKPRNEYNKKVIQLEKLLLEEGANVKAALDKNFEEYLKEKEEKAAAALAKKDAAKDAIITQISEDNEKNLGLLNNQKKETRRLEMENLISAVVTNVTSKLDSLNEAGLDKLRQEVLDKKLGDADTPDVEFTVEEKTNFSKKYAEQVLSAVKLIDDKKSILHLSTQNQNLQTENNVLKSNTPSAFVDEDDDLPFVVPAPTQEVVQPTIPEPVIPITDVDKISFVAELIEKLNSSLIQTVDQIGVLQFEDPALQSIQKKLVDVSMKNILDWTEKTNTWTLAKRDAYINHINSLQNEL